MAPDKNIPHFTAADIEKYHKGQLSAKQMHDMEKAALDDPFLADAMEGYAVQGVNVAADIAFLKDQLGDRVERDSVIPIGSGARSSGRFLRAAVMILFIAGAGMLVYKLGFTKKDTGIAKVEEPKSANTNITDTVKNTTAIPPVSVNSDTKKVREENIPPVTPGTETLVKNDDMAGTSTVSTGSGKTNPPVSVKDNIVTEEIAKIKPVVTQPAATTPTRADEKNAEKALAEKRNAAERKELSRDVYYEKAETAAATQRSQDQQSRNVAASRQGNDNSNLPRYQNNTNTFRGRVVDADNNGVPFANVTNVQDNNAGTYTDAKGNFNLTYPDSVLNVQVRSIGFENRDIQLRNSVNNNQVVMQEDRRSLSEVVMTKQKVNANVTAKTREANLKLEDPEPVDGWDNYNVYVTNNLEIPEDIKSRPSGAAGEVQVSFELDKRGEPTNIKVEKSLCNTCDKEAIRLIKEGPKWKGKAKKGRTTVTITF